MGVKNLFLRKQRQGLVKKMLQKLQNFNQSRIIVCKSFTQAYTGIARKYTSFLLKPIFIKKLSQSECVYKDI